MVALHRRARGRLACPRRSPGRRPARLDWLVAVLAESSVWLFVALALLLLYFPDGRLPGRALARRAAALLVLAAFVHHAYGAVDPAPYQRAARAPRAPVRPAAARGRHRRARSVAQVLRRAPHRLRGVARRALPPRGRARAVAS